jgi:hypothetical protein|tara:strand:+ start:124 stop:507 length:384 start_codon:yes stop_codon:yes gene_type:complete
MKYKIYYKSTGFITGILSEDDLSNQSNYESAIDYDSVVDLESELTDQVIFFDCKISDGAIVQSESDERKNLRETKQARQNRKDEYPEIGEQLDMLYHAIDNDSDLKEKFSTFYNTIKSIKGKYPKPS